jgi:hypothetical protein
VPGGEAAVVRAVAHLTVDFGREDDPVPAPATLREPAADDLLGDALAGAPAVDVRGVEEVDAELERPVPIAKLSASLVSGPKFMVPRPSRLTFSAVRPRRAYCMGTLLARVAEPP